MIADAAQLPWLAQSIAHLQRLHDADQLPHALLLAGPPGWGQAELADWLARRIIGTDAGADGPIADVAHPDLRWLIPDGAVIKIDQVRALAQFAVGTRQIANAKVAVLDQAHCLNLQSGNALLKTLEEPPAHTVLILATEYAARLLPTIRSRCQRLDIRPDAAAGKRWLEERFGADSAELAFEYGGAPLSVAAALERNEQGLSAALAAALGGSWEGLHQALVEAETGTVLLRWLRYVVAEIAGHGRLRGLQGLSARLLLEFQDELVATQRQFVSSNSVNHRLQLERLVLRFVRLPSAQG